MWGRPLAGRHLVPRGIAPGAVGGTGGGVPPLHVGPTLDWDADTADATPDFVGDFNEDNVVVGAVVTMQIASDAAFATILQTLTDTLDAAEILAGEITLSGSALSNGTYYARAKVTGTTWGNTETLTIAASTGEMFGFPFPITKAS